MIKLSELKAVLRDAIENSDDHRDVVLSPEIAKEILESLDEHITLEGMGCSIVAMLQYQNLREHFNNLLHDVFGKDYYNLGADVYSSDKLSCSDLKSRLK